MINRRDLLLRGAVLVGAFSSGALYWMPAEGQEFNPDMPDPGRLPPGVRHTELLMIPARDGARIAASLWLPEKDGRYPLILMRSLNRKQYSNPRRLAIIGELLDSGYAFMGTDIRGRFESDGDFDPADSKGHDGRDGFDIIEWIAAQSWSDGNIGTFGASHQAGYQVRAALEKPPHLRAIATWTGGYSESGGHCRYRANGGGRRGYRTTSAARAGTNSWLVVISWRSKASCQSLGVSCWGKSSGLVVGRSPSSC